MHEAQYYRFVKRAKKSTPKTISEHNPSKQDEIIRMAREACAPNQTFNSDEEWVKRFAALVAAHEREACAEVADGELMNTNMLTSYPPKSSAAWNIAAAIRARGDK